MTFDEIRKLNSKLILKQSIFSRIPSNIGKVASRATNRLGTAAQKAGKRMGHAATRQAEIKLLCGEVV